MFVRRGDSVCIVVLALFEQSFDTIKDLLTVVFIKPVMILVVSLLEELFVSLRNNFEVLLVEERYFLNEGTDNIPDVSDSAMLLDSGQEPKHIFNKISLLNHSLRKQKFCYMLDVADQPILVYLRNATCLFQNL